MDETTTTDEVVAAEVVAEEVVADETTTTTTTTTTTDDVVEDDNWEPGRDPPAWFEGSIRVHLQSLNRELKEADACSRDTEKLYSELFDLSENNDQHSFNDRLPRFIAHGYEWKCCKQRILEDRDCVRQAIKQILTYINMGTLPDHEIRQMQRARVYWNFKLEHDVYTEYRQMMKRHKAHVEMAANQGWVEPVKGSNGYLCQVPANRSVAS